MPKYQKGFAPLILLLLVALVLAVVYLLFRGSLNLPKPNFQIPTAKKEPTVPLQTKYQNPFDKNAQYINPFSAYKNPFDTLK